MNLKGKVSNCSRFPFKSHVGTPSLMASLKAICNSWCGNWHHPELRRWTYIVLSWTDLASFLDLGIGILQPWPWRLKMTPNWRLECQERPQFTMVPEKGTTCEVAKAIGHSQIILFKLADILLMLVIYSHFCCLWQQLPSWNVAWRRSPQWLDTCCPSFQSALAAPVGKPFGYHQNGGNGKGWGRCAPKCSWPVKLKH